MKMIALVKNGCSFMRDTTNIKDFLIEYADYTGLNKKVFSILANSNEMTIDELVKYINECCNSYDEEIEEIFEICNKIY